MGNIGESVVGIFTAIVGAAIVALILSNRSNTAAVIQNAGSAFSNALGVAVSPVTGSNVSINTAYAGAGINGFNLGAALPHYS